MRYPLYILPGRIIISLKDQSVIYFIGFGFDRSVLGNYSLSVSVLSIPIQVIANSISSVFLKKASDVYNLDKGKLPAMIYRLIKRLFLVSLLPFSIFTVLGDDLITLFLGQRWELAGQIAVYMSPYFFAMLVIRPIIPVMQILKRERQFFIFNLAGFMMNLFALYIGIRNNDIHLLVLLFSISNYLLYSLQGIYIFKSIKLSYWFLIIGLAVIFPSSILLFSYLTEIIMK
jgi:O-antigen/teichoic acid export membrane protein